MYAVNLFITIVGAGLNIPAALEGDVLSISAVVICSAISVFIAWCWSQAGK